MLEQPPQTTRGSIGLSTKLAIAAGVVVGLALLAAGLHRRGRPKRGHDRPTPTAYGASGPASTAAPAVTRAPGAPENGSPGAAPSAAHTAAAGADRPAAASRLASPVATKQWRTGFERGHPGEWSKFDSNAYEKGLVGAKTTARGRSSLWRIVGKTDFAAVFGRHAYKGWIVKPQPGKLHRAYPILHCDIPTPLVNAFMVYLDVDYKRLKPEDWIQLGTWGNNPEWDVHTLSISKARLHMAHLQSSRFVGTGQQRDFPVRRWVRLTVYLHYKPAGKGTVFVWQDGKPVLEGRYTKRRGQRLKRAHWGMYANGEVSHGAQYNDEIQIWSLDRPLTRFDKEPPSPYASR